MNKYGSYCPHCGGDLDGIEKIVPLDDGDMTYMEWPDLSWCRNCGTLVLLDGNSLHGWTPVVASVEGVDVHEMAESASPKYDCFVPVHGFKDGDHYGVLCSCSRNEVLLTEEGTITYCDACGAPFLLLGGFVYGVTEKDHERLDLTR